MIIIKEKCSICKGDGWVLSPCPSPVGDESERHGYDWDFEQERCYSCDGLGYIEIEVDKEGNPK